MVCLARIGTTCNGCIPTVVSINVCVPKLKLRNIIPTVTIMLKKLASQAIGCTMVYSSHESRTAAIMFGELKSHNLASDLIATMVCVMLIVSQSVSE